MADGHPPTGPHPAQQMSPPSSLSTTPGQYREIELKFEVGPDFKLPTLTQVPGVTGSSDPRQMQLAATYYDTQQLDLLAAKVTLRRRTGGDDPGWHLKLPGADGERTELTVDLDSEPVARPAVAANPIPSALHQVIRGIARGRELEPVATLRTHRTVVRLQDADGRALVEVAEDRVETGTGGTWREFEVEIIDGTRTDLQHTAQALLQAGAHLSRSPSKLGQALGAAGHRPPPRPSLLGFSRRSPVNEILSAHLHHQRDAIAQAELALRLDRPRSTSQAIGAARRFLTTLKFFRSVIGAIDKSAVGLELRSVIRDLVALEDIRVGRERILLGLNEEPAPLAAAAKEYVEQRLRERELAATTVVTRWLTGDTSAHLLRDIDAQLQSMTFESQLPAFRAIPPLLAAAWRRADRRVQRAISHPADAKHISRAVTACRDLRLAAELASSALGSDLVVIAAAVEQVEETLTDLHQAINAASLLVELATGPNISGPAAFTLGRVHSFELAGVNDTADEVADTWDRVREITS